MKNQASLPIISSLLGVMITLSISPQKALATLLVGNTTGNNVVLFDETTGAFLGDFITSGSGGLVSPDDLTFGPDGNLYISSGTNTSGNVLRFNGRTGEFIDVFTQGGNLFRPYGVAFGPDNKLYVSSFRRDQILRFNATTGAFLDVFASGNDTPNGLNGPDDLLFGPDGKLYVTTQGSVADGLGGIQFKYNSQVLRYDITTSQSTVFVDQPSPLPNSFNFVSFLGLALGPNGDLYTSDYANGIRSYNLTTGSLQSVISTSYVFFDDNGQQRSANFIGNLAFNSDNLLYTVGFDFNNNNLGAILRYDGITGNPLPSMGNNYGVFVPTNNNLQRPIGIAILPQTVSEPSINLTPWMVFTLGIILTKK